MQAKKLQHNKEQEKYAGPARDEQVLPVLPQTHSTQRNKITGERMCLNGG